MRYVPIVSCFVVVLFAISPITFSCFALQEPLPKDNEEWTPYVATKLPWTPLTPAFGLEEFSLPTPRRGAEAWRHFDVAGLVKQDYSASPEGVGKCDAASQDWAFVVRCIF